MSGFFNNKNNRFDILNDENNDIKKRDNKQKNQNNVEDKDKYREKDKVKFNSFKNDSHQQPEPFYQERRDNRRFNERRKDNNKEMEERNKELEKIKKEREREEALKETNFPELIQEKSKPKPTQLSTVNFLDKLKQSIDNTNPIQNPTLKNRIKPGWVCMEKAKDSNQVIYTYGEQTYFPREKQPIDVLNALVELHEKQIKQYDSLWGEGAYNEKYKSPYYDYEYFDRLDEQYEDEMEKLREEEENRDRDDGYDTY